MKHIQFCNVFENPETVYQSESRGAGRGSRCSQSFSPSRWSAGLILLTLVLFPNSGFAQSRKSKVPVLGKIAGSTHQAFSGVVKSLDLKMMVLNVNSIRGQDTEIFPVKKGTRVETADGKKLKLSGLEPGNDVLVYYDDKGGGRTVKKVVLLEPGAGQGKKKDSPSS